MNENNIVLQSKFNNMAQQKGHTGNPNGRPKGTPNKATLSLREFIANIIDENREQIAADLKKLTPKERLIIVEKLIQYIIPKQKEIEFSGSIQKPDEDEWIKLIPEETAERISREILDARHEAYMKAHAQQNILTAFEK